MGRAEEVQALQQAFAEPSIAEVLRLQEVQCTSRLCRLTIESDQVRDAGQIQMAFISHHELQRAGAFFRTDEGETNRFVVYFARVGDPLPPMPM